MESVWIVKENTTTWVVYQREGEKEETKKATILE